MRHDKTFGVAAVVCACACALGATPALAANVFHASVAGKTISEGEPAKSKGTGITGQLQEFDFGPFHIVCEAVKTRALVGAEQSKTILVRAKYKGCSTEAKVDKETIHFKTRFLGHVDYEYHANGFAELGEGESELRLVNPGSIVLTVPAIKCEIEWPSQTVPLKAVAKPEAEYSSVLYGNEEVPAGGKKFPSGFQKQLVITNQLKGMEYEISGGQCESFHKTEGKNGVYKGVLKEMVVGGNLSIGPEEIV